MPYEASTKIDCRKLFPGLDAMVQHQNAMSSKVANGYPSMRAWIPGDPPRLSTFSFHRYIDSRELPELRFGSYDGTFSYCGFDTVSLARSATDFCSNIAGISGDTHRSISAFLDHVRAEHLSPAHTALWLSVRVSRPSNHFDIPHWHHDGAYFTVTPGDPPAFKIGAAISGAPTHFLSTFDAYASIPTQVVNTIVHDAADASRATEPLLDEWTVRRDRVELGSKAFHLRRNEWVHHYRMESRIDTTYSFRHIPLRTAYDGEATRWIVGDEVVGAAHSEPPFTAPRLFISVLPGTEEQIRELCGKWGHEFGQIIQKRTEDVAEEYARISMTHPIA